MSYDFLILKKRTFLSQPWIYKTSNLAHMKRHLLFILTAVFTFNCYAQISFQKGYFIDDDNQRTSCLIKNIDWQYNPTEFEYKLSETDKSKKADITFVKEFGLDDFSKYIRATVHLDRSKDNLNELSNDRNPVFEEEELFLRVLIEGKASLYLYREFKVTKYFYNVEGSPIEQLIFKKYRTPADKIGINNAFRGQIWNDLPCTTFNRKDIEHLLYSKKALKQIFIDYNECQASNFINFDTRKHRDLLNLSIRPRLNSSSMTTQNSILFPDDMIEFDDKLGIGVGIELEFILPFYKDTWALLIEPTYQSFKSSGMINDVSTLFGGELNTTFNYSSIEVPMGFRHYFFLGENSKIFVDASYVFDLPMTTQFEASLYNGTTAVSPSDNAFSTENFAFGLGYKGFNKYSLEIRYQTDRKVIARSDLPSWISDFGSCSIILGYTLF